MIDLNTVWWGGGGTLTVGQAETVRWNRTDAGVQNDGADKATTTTGSYLTGWDASTSNSVVMGAVAFKPARPAPVTTAPTLLMMGVG